MHVRPCACNCVRRLVQGPSHEGNTKQKADRGRERFLEKKGRAEAGRQSDKRFKLKGEAEPHGREGSTVWA